MNELTQSGSAPRRVLALMLGFIFFAGSVANAQTQPDTLCGNQKIDASEECDGDLFAIAKSLCIDLDEPVLKSSKGEKVVAPCEKAARYLRKHYCDPKTCTVRNFCGNGSIDAAQGESCDGELGIHNPKTEYCSSSCTVKPFCGNGFVNHDRGEQCDGTAGLLAPGEFCTNECRIRKSVCGNRIIEGAEECDSPGWQEFTGKDGKPSSCRSCKEIPLCGNGRIDKNYGEVCDGASIPPEWNDSNHFCDATCHMAESTCGDHIVEGREECDAKNGTYLADKKGVCENCKISLTCGNGKVDTQFGEACDPSALEAVDAEVLPCTSKCEHPLPSIAAPVVKSCAGHRSAFFRDVCDPNLPEATGCMIDQSACENTGLQCPDLATAESRVLARACYNGPLQTRSLGICHEGVQILLDDRWSECQHQMTPWQEQPEDCDGLDNNCNGSIDEGCACETGSKQRCGTDVGNCRAGNQICLNGHWSDCQDAVMPQPEICDHQDNDCDGLIDRSW